MTTRLLTLTECKRIAYTAEAVDPMRVASVLCYATDRADLENSLRQLKANEPTWFQQARGQ
jgi:hypothetical protein